MLRSGLQAAYGRHVRARSGGRTIPVRGHARRDGDRRRHRDRTGRRGPPRQRGLAVRPLSAAAHPGVRFEVLGPLVVRVGERALHPGSSARRALLGLLLLADGRALPAERLLRAVWATSRPTAVAWRCTSPSPGCAPGWSSTSATWPRSSTTREATGCGFPPAASTPPASTRWWPSPARPARRRSACGGCTTPSPCGAGRWSARPPPRSPATSWSGSSSGSGEAALAILQRLDAPEADDLRRLLGTA